MNTIRLIATAALLPFTFVTSANAIINVTFGANGALPSSYAAAAPAPGVWNHVDTLGTTSNLVDLSGTPTGISINVSATTASGSNGSSSDNDSLLLQFQMHASNNVPWSVTFNGLANGEYDVYYYAPSHSAVSTGTFTLEGVLMPEMDTIVQSLSQGVNWDVATVNITDGELNFESVSTFWYRGLAGIQIVAVPEPSTTGLILGACVLLSVALVRRRR
jgi:hypothetical protein